MDPQLARRATRLLRASATACLLGCAGSALAEEPAALPPEIFASLQQRVEQEMARCRQSVVRIEAVDEHGKLAGTGFFIDPNGVLFTSYSLAGESRDLVVIREDQKYPARRLVADPRCGLAILQVELQTPFLPLGHSYELTAGTPVMTFGYPLDLPLTPSFGMVCGFDRKYLGRYFATTHLRANVAVQRGEGGAPLMNMKGEVVGILISSLDGGSGSFILPVEAAEKIRHDYVRSGGLKPGWLGVQMESALKPTAGSSALVAEVFPEAPCQKAGLQSGDIVLQIAGSKITAPEDMLDATFFLTAGEEVPVRIARGGEQMTIQVLPSDPPARTSSQPRLAPTVASEQILRIGVAP